MPGADRESAIHSVPGTGSESLRLDSLFLVLIPSGAVGIEFGKLSLLCWTKCKFCDYLTGMRAKLRKMSEKLEEKMLKYAGGRNYT